MERKEEKSKRMFTVPEGYFEQLNNNILSATVGNSTTVPRRKRYILGRFSRIAGYAAAIAVIFVLADKLLAPGSIDSTAKTANAAAPNGNCTESEYIDNILNNYSIDDYTFYCYLTASDFD